MIRKAVGLLEGQYLQMKKIHYLDYCSYPWEKMVITANGDVCACCAGYKIGNIDFNNFDLNILDEIWNGEVAVKLRKNLINHTPDNFCLNCVTYKISENMEYLNVEDEYERKNNSEIVPYPIDLELHITEKCNATCPMCAWNVNKGNKRNREAKFININFLKLLANNISLIWICLIQVVAENYCIPLIYLCKGYSCYLLKRYVSIYRVINIC
jgi:hypothetical protein